MIGIETITRVDKTQDPQSALFGVIDKFNDGELKAVTGKRLKDMASSASIALVAVNALSVARPGASIQYQEQDPGLTQLRAYAQK